VNAQRISEKTLLHSVAFSSLICLEKFECKVARRFAPPGDIGANPGRLVRVIDIKVTGDDIRAQVETEWAATIVSILVALPWLKEFTLNGACTPRWCLVTIPPPPIGVLTALTICVGSDVTVLSHINQLKTLQRLSINYVSREADTTSVMRKMLAAEALTLLEVIDVHLFASIYLPSEAFMHYVTRCRFHSTSRVVLQLPEAGAALSDRFAAFLDAHKFNDITLQLSGDLIFALAPWILAIETARLHWDAPMFELFQHHHLPSNLTVTVYLNEENERIEDEMDYFWRCLQQIQPFARRGSRNTILSILTELDDQDPLGYRHFLWSDGLDDQYAAFIGRLIGEAARLYKEGVIIVDGEGRNIRQLADHGYGGP
jgi:hypothetical protein